MRIINIILFVLLASQLIACGGSEERKAAYLEKADKALKTGALEKARINLKNVLQIDPKDARAYYKLGNVFEQKKNYNKAFGYYNQAVQLQPDNSEYQAKIGQFYLALAGDIDKATEVMNKILSKDKKDVNGLFLKAFIFLKSNKIDEAEKISKDIFKDHPDNVDNVLFLASLFDSKKDYKNAIQTLKKAIITSPENQKLPIMLANSLFLNNDFDKAEETFKKILDSHPDVFQNYMSLAQFYLKTNRPEKAEDMLRTAISADQNDVHRKIVLVKFLKQTKGDDAAIAELKSMIKKDSGVSDLRLTLAGLQVDVNDLDAAIVTYKNIANDFSEDQAGITARVNLAKIYMHKSDLKAASAVINKAAEIAPNDTEVNLVKAKIDIYNKNFSQAITALRTVVKNTPDNIDAYILLAASHKAINESDQAENIMTRAFENNRDNAISLLKLANYYLHNKDLSKAEKVIDAYLDKDAKSYEALSIKASILNSKKDYPGAAELAQKIINLYPEKDNGYIQSVSAMLANKRDVDAIEILKKGYNITGSVKILKLMAQLQISNNKEEDAIAELKSIPVKDRDEEEQIILSKAYLANKDIKSAKNVLLESIEQDKTRINSYLFLADIYRSQKNSDEVISTLNKGIVANPDNMKLAASLAGYFENNGKVDNAIDIYDTILAINPDNLVANNNLAVLLAEHKTDPESLKRAEAIADKLKDVKQTAIMDTVGWVYYKLGNYKDAINVLKQVVAIDPEVPVFNYHLGMAYFKNGDKLNAKNYLEKSVSVNRRFPGVDDARKTLKLL